MSYLDIGCGTAPLTKYIDESFPPSIFVGLDLSAEAIRSCAAEYPHHTWLCIKSDAFVVERRYDVVLHTGINAIRYNDWEIHGRILCHPEGRPSCVLIESGDYRDGPSDTHETYEKISGIYRGAGFLLVREDVFDIGHFPVPIRTYGVLISTANRRGR
jgi:hypothetical protein